MPDRQLHTLVHHLRKAVARQSTGGLDDAQLLEQFTRRHDETAFEVLMWRHGGMVLRVCLRVLRNSQDAEDAFQATFLILARKAATVGRGSSLAGWLYRVAYRAALRARTRIGRCGPLPDDLGAPEAANEADARDLGLVLDEEVNQLPEKYRLPFVLCYLEGLTNEEAARQLGCPRGTILSRLARGRERLRTRLTRRGVTLTGAGLAAALATDAAAAVPAGLVRATVGAATAFAAGKAAGVASPHVIALSEGVLQAMYLTRIKLLGSTLLAVVLTAAGAGLFAQRAPVERPAVAAAGGRPEAGRDGADARGVVRSVDAAKHTLTLVGQGRPAQPDQTFTVAKDAEVLFDDGRGQRFLAREAKLADLAPGALVHLRLAADKTVEVILAEGPAVQGKLTGVDAARRTITVLKQERGEDTATDKTYSLGEFVELLIDDGRGRRASLHEAKLTDLTVGCLVSLKLSPDLKEAIYVQAEGGTVQGTVKAIDAAKKTITLLTQPGRGAEGAEERTYFVAPKADVLVEETRPRRYFPVRAAKLDEVPVGASVALKLSPDMNQAMQVRAEGPTVAGTFKGADPAKEIVIIVVGASRTSDGEEKTYPVAKEVKVWIDGVEGKLADLKAGDNPPAISLKLSLDQKTVRAIHFHVARSR